MQFDDAGIGKILLEESYITQVDLTKAQEYAKSHNTSIVGYLLSQNIITPDLYRQAMAEAYGIPHSDLVTQPVSKENLFRIPAKIARAYRIVMVSETQDSVVIATSKPIQQGLKEVLQNIFGQKKIQLSYALESELEKTFRLYLKPLETRFAEIIQRGQHIAPEIIDEIFEDALNFGTSDIHFEPQGKEVLIRFRIDGVLREAGRIPMVHYENILNRIKVQSHLRIDEHFAAQDGSIHYETQEGKKAVDMRISVAPTLDGEKVVIRLLSEHSQAFTLADLGLSEHNFNLITNAAKKPFGMILVTGPTGSGKTTSLYSLVKLINRPDINITTIEDPVEYKLLGVNQIQVNKETNLTFADGLRSIVRQDPDTILVGEIRDRETAEIAVNAALTGHLLFSTFHANDSATSIPRLLDMGVEPFLLASTMEVVVAQRLVRTLCKFCRQSVAIESLQLDAILPGSRKYFDGKSSLYEGKGCKSCANSGYKGRTAIFEFIEITPEMKDLIMKNPSTNEIWHLAKAQGANSLFEDGIEKIKQGLTTLEELLRVAPAPKQQDEKQN